MASVEEYSPSARGPKFRTEPEKPEKVLEIVRLREEENRRWRQIGSVVGMSGQGALHLYRKWYTWAHTQRGDNHGTS
jgi:hypothetical protein